MVKAYLERRRMKRDIRRLNRKWLIASRDESLPMTSRFAKAKEVKEKLDPLERHFDISETIRLQFNARRLGIELPRDRDGWWYSNDIYGFPMQALTEVGQAGAKKIIRDEILNIAEKVVGLLIPILSLVVAILALTFKR